jgi:hypothetical protein
MTTVFKSKATSDDILAWLTGTVMPAAPASLYMALLTTMPTDNTGTSMVEVSGGGYARQQITGWAATATNGDGITEQKSTNATITFPVASAGWGTIEGVALYDAATAGNWYIAIGLAAGQAIVTNNEVIISSGALTLTEV